MTPKEFTDRYPEGTKVHLDMKKYGFNSFSLKTGVYEYTGFTTCPYDDGCTVKGWCAGMIFLKDETGHIHKECLAYTTTWRKSPDLRHEIPLGDRGVESLFLEEELFEI
jgi:hypothetical protein